MNSSTPSLPWSERKCPDCDYALERVEFETPPPVLAGRCVGCHGLFFEAGDLEHTLAEQQAGIEAAEPLPISAGAAKRRHYRKCPACAEMMLPVNFSKNSGTIIDVCAKHGCWLDAGELRQLADWWRTGGKAIYGQWQKKEQELKNLPIAKRLGGPDAKVWPGTEEIEPSWLVRIGRFAIALLVAGAVD